MHRILLTCSLLCCLFTASQAQLPNGSIPPNFIAQDINGNTHNLYDYLNQGKVVFLDIFATWCGPCWNYHNTHALADLYEAYGPNGTNQIMVFAIEADPSTPVSALYGIGSNTQGNWVAGTPYPILDNASIGSLYQISFYPTIYGLCPTRTTTLVGQQNTAGLYAFAQNCPPLLPLQASLANKTNIACFGVNNGSITLNSSGGANPIAYNWSTGAVTTQPLLQNLAAGNYFCTVTSGNNGNVVVGPITITGPSSALNVSLVTVVPANCSGQNGSLTVNASGGGGPYNYLWSNGLTASTISGLTPGSYAVTVQDNFGCTKSSTFSVPPAQIPLANAGSNKTLTCTQPMATLNGTSSSTGSQYAYVWDTSDGHIVAGANTLTPQVDAPGTYVLTVLNTSSNCSSTSTVVVTSNTTAPSISVAAPAAINCSQTTVTLSGSGPAGAGFVKNWTTQGGNFVSGQNTYTPVVNAGGSYTLTVTNQSNGCISTQTVTVNENTELPQATVEGATLTCDQPVGQLSATVETPNATAQWTGPGGFSSSNLNPDVTEAGTYTLTLTGANGCVNALEATVIDNADLPDLSAAGGTLTCELQSITLSATSATPEVSLLWTNAAGDTLAGAQPEVSETGEYTVTAVAPNGCSIAATVEVNEDIATPTANAGADQLLNCNAAAVVLNGAGSTSGNNYTYLWTTADGNILSDANTLSPTVDEAGIYQLEVTNTENGCSATDEVQVAQNSDITIALSDQSAATCYGLADGAATVTAEGGSDQYDFLWSNGVTGPVATGLAAGTYEVQVTDSEGCSADMTVQIAEPALLEALVNATGQTAFETADGAANCTPTGGTAPYAFLWSNGATSATITGLAPGIYSVEVTDANGCTATQAVTVNSFDCTVSAGITGQNIDCFGANNGVATVSIDGGTEPYEIVWSNNATGPQIENLAPGNYQVSITDDNGCPLVLGINITQPAALQPNLSVDHETAFGANDGIAAVNPGGGTGSYTFLWSNGETTGSINGLAPGAYNVVVSDANGCSQTADVVVEAFNCTLALNTSVDNISCAGLADGQIAVAATDGYAPFVYEWSNGVTTSTVSNLAAGEYKLTVTDERDCPLSMTFEVLEPAVLEVATTIVSNPNCVDALDGILNAEVNGGTPPYDYLWSNGQPTPFAVYLAPGVYQVSVTDANGCQQSRQIDLPFVDNLAPEILVNDVVLTLDANGLAVLSVAQVNNGSFDNCGIAGMHLDITEFNCEMIGLNAVTLTVTDENGNTSTGTAMIRVEDLLAPQIACPASITTDCDGLATYDLPVVADNCNANLQMVTGLPSGSSFPAGQTNVVFAATDAAGNSAQCAFTVTVPVVFELNASISNVSCFGGSDGQVMLAVTGGEPPYETQWSNGASGMQVTNLAAGTYTASVTDANGCVNTHVITIEEPAALDIEIVQVSPETNGGANGSIDITMSGGIAPYSYKWLLNGELVSESEDPGQLPAGSYEVLVTDVNGCTFSMTDIVVDQVTGVTNLALERLLTLMPNPAQDFTVLHCQGGLPYEVEVEVFNASGSYLQRLGYFEQGTTHIPIDLNHFVSGMYLIRIRSSEGVVVKQLAVGR